MVQFLYARISIAFSPAKYRNEYISFLTYISTYIYIYMYILCVIYKIYIYIYLKRLYAC